MQFLVAFDGSDEAERALGYAVDLTAAVGGRLTVVHVVDPAVHEDGGSEPIETLGDADGRLVIESPEVAEERGLRLLDEATELAADLGEDVATELLYGDPAEAITDFADSGEFAALFVGHRGLSAHAERLLGSVAKGVVERARLPVTVVS